MNLTTVDIIVTACVFGLVLGVWLVVFFAWIAARSKRASKMEQRLGIGAVEEGTRTRLLPPLFLWLCSPDERTLVTPLFGEQRDS